MGPFFALVVIVLLALLVVRIGANALVLTGMSLPVSRFQAASAFFGVGFTTEESEMVVNHPVRRRIILHLIVAGNVGLTSAAATLVLSFVQNSDEGVGHVFGWILILSLGVATVGWVFHLPIISEHVDRLMKASLEKAGLKRAIDFDVLLKLRDGYAVYDFVLEEGHPWANKRLHQSRPADSGLVVLNFMRGDKTFVGAPDKDALLQAGDTVTVYGAESAVKSVSEGANRLC
ncbi:TrkA C-terminal domain-containing protein [Roseibacillus persicicus]|uniref:Potassium transporter TrkA n=1 Tax=Roseibacillus persicicus TaxID=454148 RepID=A0A918TVX2_9BACT|nr:TrkA C-terminal domain-containing protein [Roseibacillus persicicus]GHC62519.1 potassium transporter TrkA [Roseibacillus persicicus]